MNTAADPHPENSARALNVQVDDGVLAKIAAYRALQTPGVLRLQPHLVRAALRTAGQLTRRAARSLNDSAEAQSGPDYDGVEIDREPAGTMPTLTVRIIACDDPPVIDTVTRLHHDIAADLARLADTQAVLVIRVLDIEAAP